LRHEVVVLEDDALPLPVKPSAAPHMEDDLAVANRKVVDLAGLGETVGLKIVPFLLTQVTLVKIDVNHSYLGTCLVLDAGMLLLDIGHFKQIKNAFGRIILANDSKMDVDVLFAMLQR
jgi:hypothetical protein